MAIADINGDGHTDVIASLQGSGYGDYDTLDCLLNDGNTSPVFSRHRVSLNGGGTVPGSNLYLPHAADLDGDGDLDLYLGETEDAFWWYENDGSDLSQFTPRQIPGVVSRLGYLINATAEDMNGDGRVDIVGIVDDQGNLMWLENKGGMPTEFAPHVLTGLTYSHYFGLAVGDIDADGDLDLVTSTKESIYWYRNKTIDRTGVTHSLFTLYE